VRGSAHTADATAMLNSVFFIVGLLWWSFPNDTRAPIAAIQS
jgi:hypothetical protein